jgi:hypothetical protein
VASAGSGCRHPGGQRQLGIGGNGEVSRGSQPRAHLVLWWLVDAAPRAAARGGEVSGGGVTWSAGEGEEGGYGGAR